jgi:Ca2+-transporting ATPase
MDSYKLTVDETVKELETNATDGLTADQARQRLEQFGTNELVERGLTNPLVILLNQFREVLVVVLIIAALVSLVLGEFTDAIVIMAIVFLNAALGFSQEYRAEQAMAALKKLAVPTVRVRRDGEVQEISSIELVPGDIVILEAGNVVPADGRMLENMSLKVEEAALTGESEPIEKTLAIPSGKDPPLGDRTNMLYMGTVVTYGRGRFIVTETGMNTELGHIADLIQDVKEEQTPLQKRLDHLGRTLALAALAIIAVVVALGLLRGEDLETLFLTGIGMAVAAVPEGLPAVVTVTLALGSQRLLKRQALIRRLPAVETLGSVTVICSDKTGTLTENRMTVTILDVAGNNQNIETLVSQKGVLLEAEWPGASPPEYTALSVLVRAGALCNDAILKTDEDGSKRAIGDPTEGALVLAAERLGFRKDELDEKWPRVAEVPFTSERKRMTTVHKTAVEFQQTDLPWREAPYVLISKGAVDSLLSVADRVLLENEPVPLDDEIRQRILDSEQRMASQGQRVLGVAFRFWGSDELPNEEELLERDQVFVGLIAMIDPPRPEVKAAVATAREAGIRPVMITGDHPLTALRIAKDLDIAQNGEWLTGQQLSQMSPAELFDHVDNVSVYARVSPEHKLNIVSALQEKGQIAAMTGDGVNDAPALKRADIGVAMGITGTDVSKEASDMVLLDDNFATIVAAVEEGRVVFDNVRKFIKYTLSSNAGELFLMLVGPLIGMPLPLLPLQILWVNLVTDGLPGLALATEKKEPGTMKRPPFHPKESIFSRGLGGQIIWIGSLMGLVSLAVGYGAYREDPGGAWQTMVFTTLVLSQMGNALAIRSNRESIFSVGLFSNKLMVYAVLITFFLQLLLIYVPILQNTFRTEALSAQELAICLAASLMVFAIIEVIKWIQRRRDRTRAQEHRQ